VVRGKVTTDSGKKIIGLLKITVAFCGILVDTNTGLTEDGAGARRRAPRDKEVFNSWELKALFFGQ
jgi:hypothetical protein